MSLATVEVTVTGKLQLAVCPSLDFAFTCTVVVPTGNRLPDAGFPLTRYRRDASRCRSAITHGHRRPGGRGNRHAGRT